MTLDELRRRTATTTDRVHVVVVEVVVADDLHSLLVAQ